MTATIEATATAPGIYLDMTNEDYHADPALSSSGARKLLPPSCPALYKHARENQEPYRKTFDIGNAAHKLALGVGPEIVVVPGERWDTKVAKALVAEAREAGHTPVKQAERDELDVMANALKAHPVAMALFSTGTPETSLFWTDEKSGIPRRARFDWLPDVHTGRMVIPDFKTTVCAEPEKFAKAAVDLGYAQQAAWYVDAAKANDLDDDPAFVFVCQEKSAPYLVTVIQLDSDAMRIGRIRNRQAIDIYAKCTAEDHWPPYSEQVELVSLPYWYVRQYEDVTR